MIIITFTLNTKEKSIFVINEDFNETSIYKLELCSMLN